MKISLDVKTDHYIKELGKRGVALQQTASESVNESAEKMKSEYIQHLKRGKVRTKYTLNAIKVYKSKPVSSSGKPRPLNNINAKVVVPNQKGKQHYLGKREETKTLRGNPMTMGRVPVPLKSSRTSQSDLKPIAGINRLTKARPQTLRIGGKKIGVKNDGYVTNKARWRTLYLASGKGKKQTVEGNLNKPFYMIDNNSNLGIFKRISGKIRKIRSLSKSSTRRKGKPDFQKSFNNIKKSDIQKNFVKKAEKNIKVSW